MADPFIGEIKMVGFDFAPVGWYRCDGQIISINQNQALFSLLGCNYGGDCRTSMGIPEFRGRVPMHYGFGPGLTPRNLGERGGSEYVPLTINEMPSHTHEVVYTAPQYTLTGSVKPQAHTGLGSKTNNPTNNYAAELNDAYSSSANQVMGEAEHDLAVTQTTPGSVTEAPKGGSQQHYNMQPYLVVNFIIAYAGLFPSRS